MDGDGRTAKVQAGYQLAGLAVALGIAIIGGIITGRVINLVIKQQTTSFYGL